MLWAGTRKSFFTFCCCLGRIRLAESVAIGLTHLFSCGRVCVVCVRVCVCVCVRKSSVCVCVCARADYTYTYADVRTHIYIHTRARTHTQTQTQARAHTRTHIHTHPYTHTHTHTHQGRIQTTEAVFFVHAVQFVVAEITVRSEIIVSLPRCRHDEM